MSCTVIEAVSQLYVYSHPNNVIISYYVCVCLSSSVHKQFLLLAVRFVTTTPIYYKLIDIFIFVNFLPSVCVCVCVCVCLCEGTERKEGLVLYQTIDDYFAHSVSVLSQWIVSFQIESLFEDCNWLSPSSVSRILVCGTANGWFLRMSTRVHIDQIMICLAQHCNKLERLEVQWDPDTIRYSDNSSKFIDQLR